MSYVIKAGDKYLQRGPMLYRDPILSDSQRFAIRYDTRNGALHIVTENAYLHARVVKLVPKPSAKETP